MAKASLISTYLFLLFQVTIMAQTRFVDKVYADANIGVFVAENDINTQFQAGLGYRINKRHGVGVSYHSELGGNVYSAESIRGIGIDYRCSTDLGFITKVGVGKVLSGWAGEDTSTEYVFKRGKHFIDLSVAYQLRFGLTFGFYLTHSPELVFATYLPASEVEPYPFDDDTLIYQRDNTRPFFSGGVTIGYALPWRKKRMRD